MKKSSRLSKSKGRKGSILELQSDHLSELHVPVPLMTRHDPSEALTPDQEFNLARYRKTVEAKDRLKEKQLMLRGAMRKFLNKKMEEISAKESRDRSR